MKTTVPPKSVKLSDEAFLRSIKQSGVDFRTELEFFQDEDNEDLSIIRLSNFQDAIEKNVQIFKVPMEDVERLCQIANDKCSVPSPNGDLATWISLD